MNIYDVRDSALSPQQQVPQFCHGAVRFDVVGVDVHTGVIGVVYAGIGHHTPAHLYYIFCRQCHGHCVAKKQHHTPYIQKKL